MKVNSSHFVESNGFQALGNEFCIDVININVLPADSTDFVEENGQLVSHFLVRDLAFGSEDNFESFLLEKVEGLWVESLFGMDESFGRKDL